MSNNSLKILSIPRVTNLRTRDQTSLKNYLKYIESNKLRYIVEIFEHANPEISISNLEYIYGIKKTYKHSEKRLSDLSTQELLKYKPIIINSLVIDPLDVFIEELYKLEERDLDVIISRSLRRTLEEIGQVHGVTRERIRQIELKTFKTISKILGDIFIHYGTTEGYLDFDLLSNRLKESEIKVLNYLYDYHEIFTPEEISGKIVVKSQNYVLLYENIREFIQNTFISNQDIQEFIEEQKEIEVYHLEIEDVSSYLSIKNFKYTDGIWVNMKFVATPYLFVIDKYFPEGIELKQKESTTDYLRMLKITVEIFNIKRNSNNVRSIIARLREYLIAIDRSIYTLPKRFDYDIFVIDSILDELNNSGKRNVYYFSEIFKMYKDPLFKAGIYNRYSLASAINRTPYKANTDRDKITFFSDKATSFYDMLNNYLIEKGTVVTTKRIIEEFPFLPIEMIHQNLYSNKEIINWGHAKHIHLKNIPLKEEFNTNAIENIFQREKYIHYSDFVMLFANEKNLKRYGIAYDYDINRLFEIIFPEKYYYKEGFIWNYESKNHNAIDRLLIYLNKNENDEISINDVRNFSSNNNLDYNNTRELIRVLETNFIRKNEKEYYPYNVRISREHLTNLLNEVKELLEERPFITAVEIYKECYLPTDNFYWTKETVVNIIRNKLADELNFHPTGVDKLLSTFGIFTTKEHNNLAEIIYKYFIELGMTRVAETELEKFMTSAGICNIGIPREFLQSDLFSLNTGYFTLKQD